MLELKSIGSLEISGVGTAYQCEGVEGLDPRSLAGTVVRLDEVTVLVRRVGTFAVMNPAGMHFELLVEPLVNWRRPLGRNLLYKG